MKVALAQINPTIGDFAGNLARIGAVAQQARDKGARLCVLPELAVCGYPPHDLLERRRFVADNLEAIEVLARDTRGIALVVGHVRPSPAAVGKPLQNAVSLIDAGRVLSTHAKALLPTYDVFDEARYFEPAGQLEPAVLDGLRMALTVCEDAWNPAGFSEKPLYKRDPVAELVAAGAKLVVNVSASPFTMAKRAARPAMMQAHAKAHGVPVLLVNQVGGNDDLIFDGRSLAVTADGRILAAGGELREDLVCVEPFHGRGEMRLPCADDEEAVLEALVLGTRDYARKCGFDKAVLGLSGGIDSALVAAIATLALGPQNVLGVTMPTRYSSSGSVEDSRELAQRLGLELKVVPIEPMFGAFLENLAPLWEGRAPDTTEENIQARIRGVVLMALSNKLGHLLLTTGNKSEMATGYCTLYGDMAGGLAVISDVPKTMVYRLCHKLNERRELIPRAIIDKPPSAELRPDQKDEDSLPPYSVLDAILAGLVDEGQSAAEVVGSGFDAEIVDQVARLVRLNEYKRRQAPPGLKVTSKSFGLGRRMPLAQRWRG
jgi:NAD+ synthetase